jgi:primary-amine oxidase
MTTIDQRTTTAVLHPLEPLSAAEIEAAVAIARAERNPGSDALFVRISLQEPPKEAVLAFVEGDPVSREAFMVIRDRATLQTIQAVVSITDGRVRSWEVVPDAQPAITFDEFRAAEGVMRADARWQAAMRERGVTDFSLAMLDAWSAGYYVPEDHPGTRRIIRALTFLRADPEDNGYARPVEGLITEFDLDRMEVVDVEDHGVVPLPPMAGNYTPEGIARPGNVPHFDGVRADLKPVSITQPEGVSFEVRGHEVRWQKWRFRIGFNMREGLMLHTIAYEDRGRLRPILYRASVSEMWVPYGDPAPTHRRKQVFDMGEYGVGMLANSLELGCDCLGEIRYFDGVVSDTAGRPMTITNAICLHEEDFGLLWKHTDMRTGKVEVRRSRRLVVSMIATVGNYEYGFFWYLYQDGTIELGIKLTGVMSTGAIAEGERPAYGALVAPGLYGPNHQHYFSVRLDTMIDGPNNSVYEVESEAAPAGQENPLGNAWVVKKRLLGREAEAQRTIDPLKARNWQIVNPSSRNPLGEPVAYRLVPGENVLPFTQPGCGPVKRAGFATKHLWVTPYAPGELYAAGDYPNQHPGDGGLPTYTAADRPIEDTDIVVWYTMGHHHVVRPEDWPVMPVGMIGFQLKPTGFFDGNPALDVPPSATGHACHE